MLVKMKRELCQAHKLSVGEDGKPIFWWTLVAEWGNETQRAKVKKEEQSTLLKIKKEEPLTPKIPSK